MDQPDEILKYEISVPMSADAELVAARAVEQIAANMRFDTRAIQQIRLALIEACINAMEHSDSDERTVHLTMMAQRDRLLVLVRDFGRGFDPLAVPEPMIQQKLSRMGNKRGWGLMLIRRMMDEVVYEDVEVGTSLRMVKYLDPEGADAVTPRQDDGTQ